MEGRWKTFHLIYLTQPFMFVILRDAGENSAANSNVVKIVLFYVYLLVRHVPFIAKSAIWQHDDPKDYFSGLTRFVYTCLGLICVT